MKKLTFIILSFVLIGCSSQWHIKKAIKKDPSIQKVIVDTLTFTQILRDTVHTSDSTFYIEERVIKYDTIVSYLQVQQTTNQKKSRFQIRQENKTERKRIKNDRKKEQTEIRQEEKTDRTKIRQDAKTERGRSWWWLWMSLGSILTILIQKLIKLWNTAKLL